MDLWMDGWMCVSTRALLKARISTAASSEQTKKNQSSRLGGGGGSSPTYTPNAAYATATTVATY